MKVTEMFPARYVKGEHLQKSRLVEIHSVETTELRAGPNKPAERAYLLWFVDVSTATPARLSGVAYTPRKGHALVLRRTLAQQIADVLGTDETDEWTGKRVVLHPEAATVAGRPMQIIRARAPKTPTPPPTPAPSVAVGADASYTINPGGATATGGK